MTPLYELQVPLAHYNSTFLFCAGSWCPVIFSCPEKCHLGLYILICQILSSFIVFFIHSRNYYEMSCERNFLKRWQHFTLHFFSNVLIFFPGLCFFLTSTANTLVPSFHSFRNAVLHSSFSCTYTHTHRTRYTKINNTSSSLFEIFIENCIRI